jgi:anti-anti-sigma regulatory factor
MATPLTLPSEITIYVAAELRGPWLDWLAREAGNEAEAEADGQAVEEIDGAGLQCLLSLARSLEAREQCLRIRQPSVVLRQACARLGATHLLAPAAGVDA